MSVNKVILIGNLGKDPEVHTTASTTVVKFSVATSEKFKEETKTEWHNIVSFGKLAEICSKYLKKGSQVYVEGKITTRKWQDKEGKDRYTTEIIANSVNFLSKNDGGGKEGGEVKSSYQYVAEQTFDEGDDVPF